MTLQLADDPVGSFVREMAVDDEEGVNHAGDPKTEGQKQVDDGLEGFAAEQDGQRRTNDGEEVAHRDRMEAKT